MKIFIEIINSFTPLILGIMTYLLTRIEKSSMRRDKIQFQYNELMLEGIQSIGNLSEANAIVSKNNLSEQSINVLDERLKEYARFQEKNTKFMRTQTISTL